MTTGAESNGIGTGALPDNSQLVPASNLVDANPGPGASLGTTQTAATFAPVASTGSLPGQPDLALPVAIAAVALEPAASGAPAGGLTLDTLQIASSTTATAAATDLRIPEGQPTGDPNVRTGHADQGPSQPDTATGNLLLGAPPPSLQFLSSPGAAGKQVVAAPVNPTEVIVQIAHALVSHRGGQELQLQLTPPNLGAVRVDVALHEGVLSARIEAQTPATQQVLADNLSQLKDSLAQQGVSFDRIDVQLSGNETRFGGSGSADPSFAQQHGDSPLDRGPGFAFAEPEDAASTNPAPRAAAARISATSLDITI